MRTTVDIPDDIFKKAKVRAVHEGIPLKEVINRALAREFGLSDTDARAHKKRAKRLIAALSKGRNRQPIGPLRREELYDRAILRRH